MIHYQQFTTNNHKHDNSHIKNFGPIWFECKKMIWFELFLIN